MDPSSMVQIVLSFVPYQEEQHMGEEGMEKFGEFLTSISNLKEVSSANFSSLVFSTEVAEVNHKGYGVSKYEVPAIFNIDQLSLDEINEAYENIGKLDDLYAVSTLKVKLLNSV